MNQRHYGNALDVAVLHTSLAGIDAAFRLGRAELVPGFVEGVSPLEAPPESMIINDSESNRKLTARARLERHSTVLG